MGLLSSLFGGKKPNYSKILSNVDSSGGRGVVEVAYEGFCEHLRQHGSVLKEDHSSITVEVSHEHQAVLIFLDRVGGANECLLEMTVVDYLDWKDPETAVHLSKSFDRFIAGRDDAIPVVCSIYIFGTNQYRHDTQSPFSESTAEEPEALKAFLSNAFTEYGSLTEEFSSMLKNINQREVMDFLEGITVRVRDPDLRLQLIYRIADAVVREHSLEEL